MCINKINTCRLTEKKKQQNNRYFSYISVKNRMITSFFAGFILKIVRLWALEFRWVISSSHTRIASENTAITSFLSDIPNVSLFMSWSAGPLPYHISARAVIAFRIDGLISNDCIILIVIWSSMNGMNERIWMAFGRWLGVTLANKSKPFNQHDPNQLAGILVWVKGRGGVFEEGVVSAIWYSATFRMECQLCYQMGCDEATFRMLSETMPHRPYLLLCGSQFEWMSQLAHAEILRRTVINNVRHLHGILYSTNGDQHLLYLPEMVSLGRR